RGRLLRAHRAGQEPEHGPADGPGRDDPARAPVRDRTGRQVAVRRLLTVYEREGAMHPKITDLGMNRLNPQVAGEPAPEPPAPAAPAEAPATPPAPAADLTPEQSKDLEQEIIKVLTTVFDPEIPVNVYELGLVYDIDIRPSGAVGIRMTLTSPACPVAGSLP